MSDTSINIIKKNERYKMKIEAMGSNGEGIGKINGFAVFVNGALPGDEIEVLIIKVKKNYGFGRILSIITPSLDRMTPICPYALQCGGCQIQHMSYEAQLRYKQRKVIDSLERIGGLKDIKVLPIIGMDNPYFYRNKAQFPVGEQNAQKKIGFFAPKSHRIIDINACALQNEKNTMIIKKIRSFLEKYNISVYEEQSHLGIVRHILTRVAFATGEIMVCIVINATKLPFAKELVKELLEIEGMASIVVNQNKQKTNVILGSITQVLWGKEKIIDYIGDIKFEISPLSFFQVNPVQTKVIYEKAVEFAALSKEKTVIDIYCGIGTISLFMAQKAKSVFGVEIVPEAIADAKQNAKINHIDNVLFESGAAEEVIPRFFKQGKSADVVVIDPPRKGCEQSVLDTIAEIQPERVVYVSCDPATLARDLAILTKKGYHVTQVQPVDQFPMTIHVEVVVSICRKDT